jgi:epoxyqueuosine reductase
MPHEYREPWGNRLYGCSTCIDVCPHNQHLTPWAEKHVTGYVGQGMRLLDALMLKESEWPGMFSDNQIGIRSYGSFIKNAITACGSLEYKKSLDYIVPFISHENEIIRAYACWALGKLHTKSTKNILERQYNQEENHLVKSEIERFL